MRKKYRLKKDAVIKTIHVLFEEKHIIFESGRTVWRALGDFQQVNKDDLQKVDFPDALILNIGRDTTKLNNLEFKGFYTFDKQPSS